MIKTQCSLTIARYLNYIKKSPQISLIPWNLLIPLLHGFENLMVDGDLKELIVHVNRSQNWIVMAKTTGY